MVPRQGGLAVQLWIARGLVLALISAVAGACATGPRQQKRAAHQEHLLTQAGFRQVAADNPEKAAALERLEAGQVVPVMYRERTFYVYPDRQKCNCLYVGRADEYDSYLSLLKQEKYPQPEALQWNEGRYSNSSSVLNPSVWGAWDWWE
jgi:hypothetical protein